MIRAVLVNAVIGGSIGSFIVTSRLPPIEHAARLPPSLRNKWSQLPTSFALPSECLGIYINALQGVLIYLSNSECGE